MSRPLTALKKLGMRALVIVAHPDDESLFMGGTIVEFKRWRWTVLCVTDCDERYNGRRRRELLRACRIYKENGTNITPFMLGVTKQKNRFPKKNVEKKLRDFIAEFGPFDIFFTHGNKGDYGHKRHKLIHDIVKKLKLGNVYNFYLPAYNKKQVTPRRYTPRECMVGLSRESRRTKKRAINVYLKGSQKTNLFKLKRLVSCQLNTQAEYFSRVN